MIYPHTVTFQEPTLTQLPSGQQVASGWDDIEDLTDLPARFIPVMGGEEEDRTARMVLESDQFTIVVQGDRAIEQTMRAATDYLGMELGVIRVQRPVLYGSPQTYATIVVAERITATVGAES